MSSIFQSCWLHSVFPHSSKGMTLQTVCSVLLYFDYLAPVSYDCQNTLYELNGIYILFIQ